MNGTEQNTIIFNLIQSNILYLYSVQNTSIEAIYDLFMSNCDFEAKPLKGKENDYWKIELTIRKDIRKPCDSWKHEICWHRAKLIIAGTRI